MLSINSKKTKFVVFNNDSVGKSKFTFNLTLNDVRLCGVQTYDYLGVRLDGCLNFKAHIQKLVASCNERIFTLAKIRRFISENIAVLIFKTMIMSKLSYGGILCLSAAKNQLSKLQKAQNQALRICYLSNRYTSNLSLHRKANVLPLFLRRKFEIFKIMHKRMSMVGSRMIVSADCRITRYGASNPPIFDTPRSAWFINTITYQAPALWASLPNKVRLIVDCDKFNTEIKRLIRSEFMELEKV